MFNLVLLLIYTIDTQKYRRVKVKIIKNANSNIISVFYTKAKMRIGITYEKFT